MKVIVKRRQSGVTTRLARWVSEDLLRRAIVVHNEYTARTVRTAFNLPLDNVIVYNKLLQPGVSRKEFLALDEIQFYGEELNIIPVGTEFISITREQ